MQIEALNHVALVVEDLDRAARFYGEVLGMWRVDRGAVASMHFGGGAVVLATDPAALEPQPARIERGSTSLCLLVSGSVKDWKHRIESAGFSTIGGPVDRLASDGAVHSVYVHDPDGNLVELAIPANQR